MYAKQFLNFILNANLGNGKEIGMPLEAFLESTQAVQQTVQDGDIPALWSGELWGHVLELTVLEGIVIGIAFNVSFRPRSVIALRNDAIDITLNREDFPKLLELLEKAGVDWKIELQSSGGKSLGIILENGVLMQWHFEKNGGLSHLGVFDWELFGKRSFKIRNGSKKN